LETPHEHVHPANVEILQVKIRKSKAKGLRQSCFQAQTRATSLFSAKNGRLSMSFASMASSQELGDSWGTIEARGSG
jgi:hypothetical protein